jgi:Uma2 family endonuclease
MNMLLERIITAEEFLSLPGNEFYELVDGKLVEKNVGAESSYLGGVLYSALLTFCRRNRTGWVFPQETTFQFVPSRPNLVRKPDVALVKLGRFPDETLPKGHIRLAPDLVVEVVSPNDLYYEVEQKVAEYRSAGVPLVWVITPPTRTALIRRADGTADEVGENGELDGEKVVPGFRFRLADLFQMIDAPASAPPA